MKPWTREAAKCVILGAITTVASAWWFASQPRFNSRCVWQGSIGGVPCYSQQVSSAGSSWFLTDAVVPSPDLSDDPDIARQILALERELLAPQYAAGSTNLNEPPGPTRPRVRPAADSLVIEHRHGWPMRALACHVIQTPDQEPPVFVWCAVVHRYSRPNQLLLTRVLPLQPMWPAFLINTLFFAAIWFALTFGFASAKRFIRAKRGRCPHCGYDLRGRLIAGCPECGWNRSESEPRA